MQNDLIYDLFDNGNAEAWLYVFCEGGQVEWAHNGEPKDIANILIDIYENDEYLRPSLIAFAEYILRNTDN